jgi:hypothetical protein
MGLSLPRYIHADPRDYFYLTLKPSIENASVSGPFGNWTSADLPHAGWPAAFARNGNGNAQLLRIDPARAIPTSGQPGSGQLVLAELRGVLPDPKLEDPALFAEQLLVGMRHAIGVAPPGAQVLLRGPLVSGVADAQAALGVDGQGLLVYAETGDKTPGALAKMLSEAGIAQAIALPNAVRLGLAFKEGVLGVDGQTRVRSAEVALRFVANSQPSAEVLFADNKPMPYSKWAQLQDQRVRYFRTSNPTARAPAGALKDGEARR